MAKKEKAPKQPKQKKVKVKKKRKEPRVIEDVFAGILTFLMVLVGICDLVLAAFIGYSFLKSKFNTTTPAVSTSSIVEVSPMTETHGMDDIWTI